MSRFHIYQLKGNREFVIDLQADFLVDLKTRIVAPLLKADQFKAPLARLAPEFTIGERLYFAAIHMISAIPLSEIGKPVLDASVRADELTAAIDFAFQGF